MSNVQLFAVNNEDQTVLIQLSDDSPIKISLSVAELNPFTPASFFSQTFRVPGVGPNVQFFKDVYSVNGASFNPAAAAQAWILQDGALFSVGNINLQAVYSNEYTGLIEYEIYFLGDTSNMSTAIGEGGMNTIDASELNHTLSYANVTASWGATAGATAGLKDGNVLYPLIEWGYTYSDATKQPEQNTLSHNYSESFTKNSNYALLMEQMKPAIRVKWLWDKIMSDAGYTYDSTFLNSDLFDSLYFVSDSVARPYFPDPSGICEITVADEFNIPVGTTVLVPYSTAVSNVDQAFNTTTHVWTCPVGGTYYFEVGGSVQLDPFYQTPEAAWRVGYYRNNILINLSPVLTTTGYSPFYRNWSRNLNAVSLNQGDTISIKIEQMAFGNTKAIFYDNGFRCTIGPNQVIMSSFLPDDTILKKIDFIRGIVRMFNLVLEPSKVVQKSFKIEPWIDWILLGDNKDWTRFYDGSADMQSSPVFFDQQRILKFGGANDEDRLNKQWQDQYKNDYMYRQYDSEIKLIKGDQAIDVPFGPVPMQSIPASGATQYPNWVFPTLGRLQPGKEDQPNSAQIQPIVPKPRLVFYNGLQNNPVNWYLSNTVGSGTSGVAQSRYPLVSPYSAWPPDLYTTLNLNFLSKQQTWSASATYIGQTATDLYTRYWADYVSWLYDPYNRKVNLTLRLSPAEIINFKFNDKIWIKDTWYFVRMIKDYLIGDTSLLKCELVKVPLAAIPGPIPTPATGGTGGTTCQKIFLCNNNSVEFGEQTYTYVDCDSNLASVTIGGQACGEEICALYPLINPLPSGWSALDGGSCGSTGANLTLQFVSSNTSYWPTSPYTTVTVYGSSGGTAGTYTQINNFTVDGDQDMFILQDLPVGYGVKVGLASSLTPGATCTSQVVALGINGTTGPTASRSGTYQPIEATFTAVITAGSTYTAYTNINY